MKMFALLALLASSGALIAAGRSAMPTGTITHPLLVGYHTTVSLTPGEVDQIASSMSQVLAQCNTTPRIDSVSPFSTGTGVVNSQADFMDVGTSIIKGVPRKVRVVAGINWCGTFGAGIIGCAPTPGTFEVVVRMSTTYEEGLLWAHEFGHTKGLPHRDVQNAVMRPYFNSANTVFDANECQAIHSIARVTKEGPPMRTASVKPTTKVPIQEFIRRIYIEMIPFAEASAYSTAEAAQLAPMLNDPAERPYWRNIVVTLAIAGDGGNSDDLMRFAVAGQGQTDAVDARAAAIVALGYVLNKTRKPEVLQFLLASVDPTEWPRRGTAWKFGRGISTVANEWQLVAQSLIALGLSGVPEAIAAFDAVERKLTTVSEPDIRKQIRTLLVELRALHSTVKTRGLMRYYSH